MKIESIEIANNGHVYCKSSFYSVHDILNDTVLCEFYIGINTLIRDIDSGNRGISYLLSMYHYAFGKRYN